MYKVVIIDDEERARLNITKVLELHDDIKIIGEADNCKDAYDIILVNKPDIVFLDIKMPQEDGFSLLDYLTKLGINNLTIIFLTAYDEFAIKAIKYGVFDYLLKPVDTEALKETLNRYRAKQNHANVDGMRKLMEILDMGNKIKFITNTGYVYFLPRDIMYVCADGSYSKVFTTDKNFHQICRSLKEIEAQLTAWEFIRVHKSYLINKQHLIAYNKIKRSCTLKKDSISIDIPVSFRNAKNISF